MTGLLGHCRRRKIRCLLASDDMQQRCLNCIKLKKECSFLPVDPQAQGERRPRTKSAVEARSGETSGSASSSPPLGSGNLIHQVEDFNQFPPLPLSIQDFPPSRMSLSASSASPASRGTFYSPLPRIYSSQLLTLNSTLQCSKLRILPTPRFCAVGITLSGTWPLVRR